MPSSATPRLIQSRPILSRSLEARTTTLPPSVNFRALLSKFSSAWRTLVRSACIDPRSSGQSSRMASPAFSAIGSTVSITPRTIDATSKVSG